MAVGRRRFVQSLALAGGCGSRVEAAEPAIALDVLRSVCTVHGSTLSDDRLRVVKPILERRIPQLRAFRDLEIDDAVTPTHAWF